MQKKKLLNFRPFVFTAVSIALGVVSGSLFYFEKVFFGVLICVLFLGIVVLSIFGTGDEKKKKCYFAIVFVLLFVIGLTSFLGKVNGYEKAVLNGSSYTITGKVIEVGETDYGSKIVVDKVVLEGKGSTEYKISLYVNGKTDADVGQVIRFSCALTDKDAVYEDRLSATDIERGVKYIASIDATAVSVIGSDKNVFDHVHLFFRDTLKSGLGEDVWPTAYGLLIGNTDQMDYDLINSYRESGVAHIFAVSGLHVGFLASVLNYVFNKFNMNKTLKAIIVTIVLIFYSGVCGFSASSVRASIMSAIMLFSAIGGKRYDGLSSVGLSCTIILLYSPLQLFCVGFQLSFVVVLGIILLSPIFSKLFKSWPEKLSNSIGVVLSAWIVGIPVQLAVFGKFSLFAILANFLLIPVVGVLYIALFVAVLIGGLFGIQTVALFLPGMALKLINIIINALDYKAFIVSGLVMGGFAILFYLATVIISGLINLKNLTKIISVVLCVAICIGGTAVKTINENNAAKAYVIGTETESATIVENGEQTVMVLSDSGRIASLGRYVRLRERTGITEIDTLIFTKGASVDLQVYITRLRTVFDIKSVAYYGQDEQMEKIIFSSFGIKALGYSDGQTIDEKTECKYLLDGYAVELYVHENRVAIFSKLGNDYAGYLGLNGEYYLMVAVDYVEQIYSTYETKNFISYLNYHGYVNAYGSGTATVYLS